MKSVKYLCKWSNNNQKWENYKYVDFSFFCNSNGYEDSTIFMIEKLSKYDCVDLSDGISQYHEVQRLN